MDDYNGRVETNGPWAERIDGTVGIRKLSVGAMDNNAYIISCRATRKALIVDLPSDSPRLVAATEDLHLSTVVLTHGHRDHIGAWRDFVAARDVEVWGHPGDAELFPSPPDRELADRQILEVGELAIEVLHVPGHTPGSVLLLVEGDDRHHLFSGDTLFPGGHGKTATPSDHVAIMDGLETRVFDRLDDTTWVYPGHGDDTVLGHERPHLAEWRRRGW